MAKIPVNQQANEYHLRPGSQLFPQGQGWAGVNTEDDPGSLMPWELQRGENVRLRGKIIINRAGLVQKVAPGSLDGKAINLIAGSPSDNPRVRLWLSTVGCFGTGIGTGATIMHLDPTESPALQTYGSFYATADRQIPIGSYSGKLFVGDKTMLREAVQTSAQFGFSVMTPSVPQAPIAKWTGFTINCLKEFDGKLFIGLSNDSAPASSKIAVWDGLSFQDDITGIRPPLAFGLFQNKLVAGFDATAANIRVRDPGTAPGTWNTFALAGFLCATQQNCMAEHQQYLYIASGNNLIHRFDGAAITLIRTIGGCAVDGKGCTALALHNGLMYYGWNTPSAAYLSRIGRHDPDSTGANEWTDTYKDVTANQASFIELSSMASYRRQIVVGGRQVWVVATAVNDVQGTIEVLNNTGAPGAGFQVVHLLRYP